MALIEIFPKAIGKYSLEKEKHFLLKEQCFSLLSCDNSKFEKTNTNNFNLHHYFNQANQNLLNVENFDWFENG